MQGKGNAAADPAKVEKANHDAEEVTTGAEGRAELKVTREGFNVLAVEHSVAHANKSEVDTVRMMSSLTLESKHDHNH